MTSSFVMAAHDRGNEQDELIERLEGAGGGRTDGGMIVYESDGLTPDVQEPFWRNFVDFERQGAPTWRQS